MAGAYPKPDSQRQRANAPTFDWKRLPAEGNPNPAPPMPIGTWHPLTQQWWLAHWAHPCATQWRTDDPAHERLAMIHDVRYQTNTLPAASTMSEMRQLEDRLGLSPKSRLQLRWMIVDGEGNPTELAVVRGIDDAKPGSRKRNDPRLA